MKATKKIVITSLSLLAFPMLVLASEIPQIPLFVYGDVKLDNQDAPIGTNITITNPEGENLIITTKKIGKYSVEIPAKNKDKNLKYIINAQTVAEKICPDPMLNPTDEINLNYTTPTPPPAQKSSGGGGGGGAPKTPKDLSITTTGEILNNQINLIITGKYTNMMMISNTEDFKDAKWQGFNTEIKNWQLDKNNIKVYIKFKSSGGKISKILSCDITRPKLTLSTEETSTSTPKTTQEETPIVKGIEMDYRTIQLHKILSEAKKQLTLEISQETLIENDFYTNYTLELLRNTEGLSIYQINAITNFIQYGSETTLKLGAGERAGILGSYKSAFTKLPTIETEWADLIKIGNGRWPDQRSETAEQNAQLHFRKIYKRDANMDNPNDNAAITIISYGLRADIRNIEAEKVGILTFKHIYKYHPKSATDWDITRAIAYSGATR